MSELLPYPSIRLTSFFKYLCQSLLDSVPESLLRDPVLVMEHYYVLPPVACAGDCPMVCAAPDDNMVGLYSLSVEKSVPLFLQTYSVSDEFFNKGLS